MGYTGQPIGKKPYDVYDKAEVNTKNTEQDNRLTATEVVANAAAKLGGSATQTFKVANAVNADEAIAFGQFTGYVLPFATSTVPSGFLECNGSALSRTTYADLFAVVGTTYGVGDGSTTFNIPDLRGEFIRGFDNGRGIDGGRAIGTAQLDDFKSHSHNHLPDAGGLLTQINGANSYNNGSLNYTSGSIIFGLYVSTDTAGGVETRPRNIAMMYCIKY